MSTRAIRTAGLGAGTRTESTLLSVCGEIWGRLGCLKPEILVLL